MNLNLKSNKGTAKNLKKEAKMREEWRYWYHEALDAIESLKEKQKQLEELGMSVPKGAQLPERDLQVMQIAKLDLKNGLEHRRVRPDNLRGITLRADRGTAKIKDIFCQISKKEAEERAAYEAEEMKFFIGSNSNWEYCWNHLYDWEEVIIKRSA